MENKTCSKREWQSEAAALRMVGSALEEIEEGMLRKMGGQFCGLSDWPIETGLLPGRMGYAKFMIMFDMDRMKVYMGEYTDGKKERTRYV
jgi:hypothetical protein